VPRGGCARVREGTRQVDGLEADTQEMEIPRLNLDVIRMRVGPFLKTLNWCESNSLRDRRRCWT